MLMSRNIGSLFIAFILTIIMIPLFIKFQKKYKIGQRIRQEGPDLHQHKTGTPTMGGLVIIISILFVLLLFPPENAKVYVAFALLCGFGLVGFIDDFIKFHKERSLGLKARTKIAIQILVSILFFIWYFQYRGSEHIMIVPFLKNNIFVHELFFIPFSVLVFLSSTNAVNLTDGLDGLATGLMMIALVAFSFIAFEQEQKSLGLFALTTASSCFGFLFYNSYPAKIFLGDVGSLGLGGLLSAIAIMTGTELFLMIIGGVFVLETLSVIIQVTSIKFRGKPVFRMSPVHHHFELLKWKEVHIVILFWGAGLVFSLIALIAYPF